MVEDGSTIGRPSPCQKTLRSTLGTLGSRGRNPITEGTEGKKSASDGYPPYTVRTDNTQKVRFSAMVGQEPEVELVLVLRLRTRALSCVTATQLRSALSVCRNAVIGAYGGAE